MAIGYLFVRTDRVYGNVVVYPDCPNSQAFAEIAGTKTLSHKVLCLAERMGFEIVNKGGPALPVRKP